MRERKAGIRMMSLETANDLKESGLKWEPNFGDMYWWSGETNVVDKHEQGHANTMKSSAVFLPRLDQLLAEIEKRECAWELSVDEADKPPYAICLSSTSKEIGQKWFQADSPEEAAAQALIWILEQEVR